MKTAVTISEVLDQQEAIVQKAIMLQSRAAYFAVLYRKMTIAVQHAIANNQFEDNKRMERLIVNFANLYLQAWNGFTNKQTICNAWQTIFPACENKKLIVLQHLMLGINTHINLDLAKAAVQTCPGDTIFGLKNDFEKINEIIASLAQQVQTTLEKIWWPLKLLTDITNKKHEAVLNFSISNARKASWANAIALSLLDAPAKAAHIVIMEEMVNGVSRKIINPGGFTQFILKPVLWMEPKEVRRIIDLLQK